jgi:hypothetical protein
VKHLEPINRKAGRIEAHVESGDEPAAVQVEAEDVVALQTGDGGAHIPLGCSLAFFPGWEVDSSGGTAGLCQPVERDLFDCHLACFWPAHVPDQLNYAPDWTAKCAAAQKDWRNIDLIFP